MSDEKKAVHQSHLGMLLNCPEQYRRRYVENDKRPPGVAAHIGTGVHRGADLDMKRKIRTGELAEVHEVKEIAAEATDKAFREDGVHLLEDEETIGLARVRGKSMDLAVEYAELYHEEIAPQLEPLASEREFRVTSDEFPVDLAGTIDLLEEKKVRDLKTRGSKPAADIASKSLQGSIYTLAASQMTGEEHYAYTMDFVVKTKKPYVHRVDAKMGPAVWNATLETIRRGWALVEAGIFPPANPDWWGCSQKWCGYWDDCPFGRRARIQG